MKHCCTNHFPSTTGSPFSMLLLNDFLVHDLKVSLNTDGFTLVSSKLTLPLQKKPSQEKRALPTTILSGHSSYISNLFGVCSCLKLFETYFRKFSMLYFTNSFLAFCISLPVSFLTRITGCNFGTFSRKFGPMKSGPTF